MKLKKLIPNLYDKKNYICHIKNIQYYLKMGMIIFSKIHRVLKFKQSHWLKPYIDFNTQQRALSKNKFEKDLYKLMNKGILKLETTTTIMDYIGVVLMLHHVILI
jgi:hypothetical protein